MAARLEMFRFFLIRQGESEHGVQMERDEDVGRRVRAVPWKRRVTDIRASGTAKPTCAVCPGGGGQVHPS